MATPQLDASDLDGMGAADLGIRSDLRNEGPAQKVVCTTKRPIIQGNRDEEPEICSKLAHLFTRPQ